MFIFKPFLKAGVQTVATLNLNIVQSWQACFCPLSSQGTDTEESGIRVVGGGNAAV
jgi:hypothetical protein